MNTKKFILINLLQSLIIMIVAYKSFFKGFENESLSAFISSEIVALTIIFVLLLNTCLTNIGFVTKYVIRKKNCFRISFFSQIIITLYFIYSIISLKNITSIILSTLSIIVLFIQYKILKELFSIVRKIFLKEHK